MEAALPPEPSWSWFVFGSPRLSLMRCNDSRGLRCSAHSSRSPQCPAREEAGSKPPPPSCCGTFLSPPFPGVTPPQVFQAPGEVPHFTVSKVLSSSQAGKGARELVKTWPPGGENEAQRVDIARLTNINYRAPAPGAGLLPSVQLQGVSQGTQAML